MHSFTTVVGVKHLFATLLHHKHSIIEAMTNEIYIFL
jgi:hypothetical protein